MAEVCVDLLLKKLQDEEKLLSSFREDSERISDELEFMKTFLRVAESMEDSNFDLKLWLLKVIEIVYYMDDALDEFRLNLASDNRHGFFVPKLLSCIINSKDRLRLSLKMQDIKSRVKDISKQHKRYWIKHGMIIESFRAGEAVNHLPRKGEADLLEEAKLVGIEGNKQKLIDWLVDGKSDRQVVSVVGVGGLGKTTLVKSVFDDAEVKKHFKFCSWITVSQFSKIEDLLKDLIDQLFHVLHKADPVLVDSMNESKHQAIRVVNDFLQQRRYLIVLDNVWDAKVTDAFEQALPDNNYGSRIMLTTREAIVASSTRSPVQVFNLKPLSAYDSRTLFSSKVFQRMSCPPSMEAVTNKILKRCEGLPLAIVVASGVLATKSKSRTEEWEKIYRSLDCDETTTRLRKAVVLSYNDLPYYLKSCLLYLSLFQAGQPIKCSRLVRLWISEGFVNERGAMTLEQVAETYLNELIKRSLVQVMEKTVDGRVKRCHIHDLVYEMLTSKAKDLSFLTSVKDQGKMWLEKARHLSIHHSTPSIEQRSAPGLRSLLISCKIKSPVFNMFLEQIRLINVLDLEGTSLKEFPKHILKLRLLKYLSLRNTKVKDIPRSIGNLQHLETLDLKHACVTELPTEILKLQKLHHLLVYRYEISPDDKIHNKYGVKVPNEIGSLQSIQKLCFIEANDESSKLMKELGKLNNLRRLGITKLKKENGKALSTSIEKLVNLRALSITSMEEKETIDLDHICYPPQYLQRLYLAGNLKRVPDWISSLDCLVKVVLKWSRLSDDPFFPLQNLPKLVHLELIQAYEGTRLCLQHKAFRSLKFLGLNKLENVEVMVVEKGAMSHLEKLVIQNCYSMVSLPLGIEQLFELKVLEFINIPIELIMKVDPSGEHGDHWKVEHVPEVHFSYSNNGNWDVFSLNSSRRDMYQGHRFTDDNSV